MSRALPEKRRLARNIHEGYEIKFTDGQWREVIHALHIYAPMKISSFTFSDGERESAAHDDEVMSRRAKTDES